MEANRRIHLRARMISAQLLSTMLLVMMAGCEGDPGPAGVQGPPGQPLDVAIEIVGEYPVLRADGTSSVTITAEVRTLGGSNVSGINVHFRVVSGGGSVSPPSSTTDETGDASCVYTVGTQAGTATVAASLTWSGLTIADTRALSIDPLAVSPPLLTSDFDEPLMGQWSHDGSFVIFQPLAYNSYSLYKADAQGGNVVPLGSYRGGAAKPDGSELIAAFEPPSGGWPEDGRVFLIDYDGNVVGTGFRPAGFIGDVRAVCWTQNGDSLLIASNTNALYYVCAANGGGARSFEMPFWGHSLSPVANSPYVVVDGSGEESGGVFSLNIMNQNFEQLVIGDNWYSVGPNISGATVDSQGATVVYSARKKTANGYQDQNDLFMIPFTGGVPVELLAGAANEVEPAWSPDGTRILFSSNRSGTGYNLYVYTPPQE